MWPPLKLIPSLFNVFKMLIDDLSDLPSIVRGEIVGKRLLDIEALGIEPVFAFHLPFSAMDMDRLVPLVGLEKPDQR
jgi:hypothetical protein